jgi:hypothetical protein
VVRQYAYIYTRKPYRLHIVFYWMIRYKEYSLIYREENRNESSILAMWDNQHIISNILPQTQGRNLWNLKFASWTQHWKRWWRQIWKHRLLLNINNFWARTGQLWALHGSQLRDWNNMGLIFFSNKIDFIKNKKKEGGVTNFSLNYLQNPLP